MSHHEQECYYFMCGVGESPQGNLACTFVFMVGNRGFGLKNKVSFKVVFERTKASDETLPELEKHRNESWPRLEVFYLCKVK